MAERRFIQLSDEVVRPQLTGVELLHDPLLNKGTAFTVEERERLGLVGLLPPRVSTIEQQEQRILDNYGKKSSDLEKYIFLLSLQDRNKTLFYRVILNHLEEMMPIIYTPTVGRACQLFGHIYRRARGIYIALHHRGKIREILRNWPDGDIRVIVITDGERILGLGDLGANGMGIPIGKLSLYTACAGIHPCLTLPVTLDVGTNNDELLNDPLYLGTPQRRITGVAYDELVDEFISAAQEIFPRALIQFEDFAGHNAFRLLAHYRDRICTFNDDIQGTAAVALTGLYSAMRLKQQKLSDQVFLFYGAGQAGTGIGSLLVSALTAEGLSEEEARRHIWLFDVHGLIHGGRRDLLEHQRPFAHDHPPCAILSEAIRDLRPSALIGVSGCPNQFTREIIEKMAHLHQRPILFALSNPTSKAECTAEQAYAFSKGKAIFASGSPFPPCAVDGQTFVPGQSNNAYIFPGVGLGVVISGARRITDEMFFESAKVLAGLVAEEDLAKGCLFPPLRKIREVSAQIAAAVAAVAYRRDLAAEPRPADLLAFARSNQYQPTYKKYL